MDSFDGDVSPLLFAAAACLIREDRAGLDVLRDQMLCDTEPGAVLSTAAMVSAEYLREAALARGLEADQMIVMLRRAHAEMVGRDSSLVELILSGVHAYVIGAARLWDNEALCDLARSPRDSAGAAIRVLAAALTWRSRDFGMLPDEFSTQVCLALARRATTPVSRTT